MSDKFNEYRYDNCSARGICSSNPKTSALQEVLFLYLKQMAFYVLKLEKSYSGYSGIKRLILFSVSVMVSDTELFESDFNFLRSSFEEELSKIIQKYKNVCKKENKVPELLNITHICKNQKTVNDFIRLGESEYNKKNDLITTKQNNLYKILFLVIKSLCINIITASNYSIDTEDDYKRILVLLNMLIKSDKKENEINEQIKTLAEHDFELMKKIREAQVKRYGEQTQTEVSYSTEKGKAVLVVGSDIYELEKILSAFHEYDVYTHDEMLTAHTFPWFKNKANLKGQYGIGYENCLLDFSTFPGPIILTRNSLYNVQNLYRGRLFTTDFAHSKGVIRIINDDFSQAVKAAEESRGFKTGRTCTSEQVGFNYKEVLDEVVKKTENEKYSKLVILGNPEGYAYMEDYYRKFLEHVSDSTFVLSLFCCEQKENLLCINASYDNYALAYFAESINTMTGVNKGINIFIPVCKKHTISDLVYLSSFDKINVFWNSECCKQINPSIIGTLTEILGVNIISTPKSDLEKLI